METNHVTLVAKPDVLPRNWATYSYTVAVGLAYRPSIHCDRNVCILKCYPIHILPILEVTFCEEGEVRLLLVYTLVLKLNSVMYNGYCKTHFSNESGTFWVLIFGLVL